MWFIKDLAYLGTQEVNTLEINLSSGNVQKVDIVRLHGMKVKAQVTSVCEEAAVCRGIQFHPLRSILKYYTLTLSVISLAFSMHSSPGIRISGSKVTWGAKCAAPG